MNVSGYPSWTKTAMSQAAKDSLLDNSLLTPSSGISLNTRYFLFPCKQNNKHAYFDKDKKNLGKQKCIIQENLLEQGKTDHIYNSRANKSVLLMTLYPNYMQWREVCWMLSSCPNFLPQSTWKYMQWKRKKCK